MFLLHVFAVWEALPCCSCGCVADSSVAGEDVPVAQQNISESALFQMLDVLIRGQQNNSSFF